MMRCIIITVILFPLLLFATVSLEAQDDSTELIFIVDDMALFENQDPAISFSKYLRDQIERTDIPKSDTGRVIVQFWVDNTGAIVEPNILRGLSLKVDSIVYEIVHASPKWTPAKQRGKSIKIAYTFPIYIHMNPPRIDGGTRKKNRERKSRIKTTLNVK
jgi:hypothetical protein